MASRNWVEAMHSAKLMGYKPIEHGRQDTLVEHEHTGTQVTIPMAQAPMKRWTGAMWQSTMKSLVMGATSA